MLAPSLRQDNVIFYLQWSLRVAWFSGLKLCFDLYASLIFPVLCCTNKILSYWAIVLLFCSNIFKSFECDGKSISLQLYWSIKGLIFDILWVLFSMFWWFNQTVKAYWKQLLLFFRLIVAFLFFNHLGESMYDLPLVKPFFESGNAINQYYQEQTRFLSLVLLNFFDNFVKGIQKDFW